MPVPSDFLHGFGFRQDLTVGGYTLTSANATHETVSRYQVYQYHITLVFTPSGKVDYDQLVKTVKHLAAQKHTIKATRNYYDCYIDPVSDIQKGANGSVTFHLVGHANRAHN